MRRLRNAIVVLSEKIVEGCCCLKRAEHSVAWRLCAGLSKGAVAGIVVAALVVALVGGGAIGYLVLRQRSKSGYKQIN